MEQLQAVPEDGTSESQDSHDTPDWEALADELCCPLCEYNLRGLREPRCPECGYKFAWRDLTDPRRRKHPYVFEHHPERNWWSFWKTARGGLRPVRFWTSLFPSQASRPKRLVLYCVLTMLVAAAGVAAVYGGQWVRLYRLSRTPRLTRTYMTSRGLYTQHYYPYVETMISAPASNPPKPPPLSFDVFWRWAGDGYLRAGMIAWAWPWLTFSGLLVFQLSMRRARIKSTHVLRCVVYSGDGVIWASFALIAVAAWVAASAMAGGSVWFAEAAAIGVAAAWLISAAVRLGVAYQKYLRFDHPWATVLASQVMVIIVALNLVPHGVWRDLFYWMAKQGWRGW